MSAVTTHVLDTATGSPAVGMAVLLERAVDGGRVDRRTVDGRAVDGRTVDEGWEPVANGLTDDDGRCGSLGPEAGPAVPAGVYRLSFATGDWFSAAGRATFYPQVVVLFTLSDDRAHHHVPLLLSPYAYSTYRGS